MASRFGNILSHSAPAAERTCGTVATAHITVDTRNTIIIGMSASPSAKKSPVNAPAKSTVEAIASHAGARRAKRTDSERNAVIDIYPMRAAGGAHAAKAAAAATAKASAYFHASA